MGQLLEIEPQLNEAGFQLIGVSPDRPLKVRETMERHRLHGRLLSDSQMSASLAFGVAYKVDEATLGQLKGHGVDLEEASGEAHHLLPVPAVFVTGSDGVIQFSYANPDYKVRLSTDVLLAAVRVAGK